MIYPLPSVLKPEKVHPQEYTCIPEYGHNQVLIRQERFFIFDDSNRFFESRSGTKALTRKILLMVGIIVFGFVAIYIFKKHMSRRRTRR